MKTNLLLYDLPYQPQAQARHNRREKALYCGEFRCLHCGSLVSIDPFLAGVNHRNHCPYCLWSRHLDLLQPGDRLAACKAPMQPVGLALKRTPKRYAAYEAGELLIIHHCTGCGRLSLNRLAADDLPEQAQEVFYDSWRMAPFLRRQLVEQGITALQAADRELVESRLLGKRPV